MNKEEERARDLCAISNWSRSCRACANGESLAIIKPPKIDPESCGEWKHYKRNRIKLLLGSLLCRLGLHDWFNTTEQAVEMVRICTRCSTKEKFVALYRGTETVKSFWEKVG